MEKVGASMEWSFMGASLDLGCTSLNARGEEGRYCRSMNSNMLEAFGVRWGVPWFFEVERFCAFATFSVLPWVYWVGSGKHPQSKRRKKAGKQDNIAYLVLLVFGACMTAPFLSIKAVTLFRRFVWCKRYPFLLLVD